MPSSDSPRPLVGLAANVCEMNQQNYHSINEKYLIAISGVSKGIPLIVPALSDMIDIHGLLDRMDGIVVTGAVSNVHPPHYGQLPTEKHEPYDHHRDALTLALIAEVLRREMPLLCICRGFQELNVVLGGTLEAELHDIPGRLDHRGAKGAKDVHPDVTYDLAHKVALTPGGILATLLGRTETTVNSIHRQGVAILADGLVVEAVAPDGTIEAVSVKDYPGFALGFQWHPEHKALENQDSWKIFDAFGKAMQTFRTHKS